MANNNSFIYFQTLRRLAQNREAARKSRLRKKVGSLLLSGDPFFFLLDVDLLYLNLFIVIFPVSICYIITCCIKIISDWHLIVVIVF